MRTSWPSRRRAFGKAATTSPSPPVFAKGAHSDATKRRRSLASSLGGIDGVASVTEVGTEVGDISTRLGLCRYVKPHGGQWGQIEHRRIRLALPGLGFGGNAANCAHPATAESTLVRVQNLTVLAGPRQANAIALTYYRRKVADHNQLSPGRSRDTHKGDNVSCRVIGINPLKACRVHIVLPQCGLFAIDSVEFAHEILQPFMVCFIQQVPVQAVFVVPFA